MATDVRDIGQKYVRRSTTGPIIARYSRTGRN